jgi:hypothetical protein
MAFNREKTLFRDGHHRTQDKVARLCVPGKTVEGEVAVTVPDYVAIGALVVLIVWAVADWIPRSKL